MPWYWEGEKTAPLEIILFQHNESKTISYNYYLIQLKNEDDIKTNTGKSGCHFPLPR